MPSPDRARVATDGWTGGQASLLRWSLGVTLAAHHASVAAAWLAGPERDALLAGDGRAFGAVAGGVTFALAAVGLAVGLGTRFAALVLAGAAIVAGAGARVLPLAVPLPLPAPFDALGLEVFALLWVACWPPAPYGSFAARGRPDPRGGWALGRRFDASWRAWSLFALVGAWGVWRNEQERLRLVEEYGRRVSVEGAPWAELDPLVLATTSALLVVAATGWWRRGRPVAWAASLGVLALLWCGSLGPGTFWPWGWFLLALFDPAWIPPKPGALEVYYDGECALCQGSVRFLLAEDRFGRVSFGPQSGVAFAAVADADTAAFPDSLVVRADGGTLVRSAGVLRLLAGLGGLWRVAGVLGSLVPRFVRDRTYDAVAGARKRLGVPAATVCPVAGEELVSRFLP